MDFRFTPEQERFRADVRDFIAHHWPAGRTPGDAEALDARRVRTFRRALAERGWLTLAWPTEHGGLGLGPLWQAIYIEEMASAGAPYRDQGVDRIGPTLMLHGTEDQRRRHLPPIARAESWWCQGFSEPGAGSDLASLQTRSVLDGDEFIVSGQKIWTSYAHQADWMVLLVRTDPDAPKHRGISFLLVDVKTPGITVRPLVSLPGHHSFNEVFFEDVRVPRENLVGELNRGWYVATTTLDFERSGIDRVVVARRLLETLLAHARERGVPRTMAMELSELRTGFEVARMIAYRVAWLQQQGLVPNREASQSKLLGTEVHQRLANLALRMLGPVGLLRAGDPLAPLAGLAAEEYLGSVAVTVQAGTSEIQRNIIATRGLGLPRS